MTVSKHILLFAFLSISAIVKSEDCVNPETAGSDYTGTVNVTKSGLTCQKWNSQLPHGHTFGVEIGDINLCRNPDEGETVWCYTIDPDTRWEYCDVPLCDSTNTTTTSSLTTTATVDPTTTDTDSSTTTTPSSETTTPSDDTTTPSEDTTSDDTTKPSEDTTSDDTTTPSDDTTTGSTTTEAPSNCECIDPKPAKSLKKNTDINHCDNPQGFQICNVLNNQTCPDMFCDQLDRCFSVLACPDQAIPEETACEDCACMDKNDQICRADPLGHCNLCDNGFPKKICRVPVDSKCPDKYCVDNHSDNSKRNVCGMSYRCYAVSACDCDKNKPTTTI